MASFCESQSVKSSPKKIVPVLLIANIIMAVIAISLVATKRSPTSTIKKDVFKQSLDKLYRDVNRDLQVLRTKTLKQARAVPSLEFLSLLKPIVHLSGLDFDKTPSEYENRTWPSPIRNWAICEGSERTLMYNGMGYGNGSVVVPASGIYFIYSHVKFYVEDNNKDSKQNVFHHKMVRYNAVTMTEDILLSNQISECKEGINDGAHLEYPSDIRGVVRLNAGDQLTVKTSEFDLLKHDRDWHYLGAYLI